MQSKTRAVVVLGTGGTIAGTASDPSDPTGYKAAQLGVEQLVQAVPALSGLPVEIEQVAQIDSKDMSHAVWRDLARRCAFHLRRDDVAGIVVTHGTDTLEETAWFLQRLLAPAKPIVITGAMKPANVPLADGPQNLLDAVMVAREPGACGVVAVMAGKVHGAHDVCKLQAVGLDAFSSGSADPLGVIEEGVLQRVHSWPSGEALGVDRLPDDVTAWPRVEIVTSHAGTSGDWVHALQAAGVQGIVVAGTGNGTVHHELEAALIEAQRAGLRVLRSTRCGNGRVVPTDADRLPACDMPPAKARVELLLQLL